MTMRPSTSFVAEQTLEPLGLGAQLTLWSFRSCALGHTQCCCLVNVFKDIFGERRGPMVLGHVMSVSELIRDAGHRRLKLTEPNCIRFTHDETSILSAFAAAQSGRGDLRDAHLTWILGGPPELDLIYEVDSFAAQLFSNGLVITSPEIERQSVSPDRSAMSFHTVHVRL